MRCICLLFLTVVLFLSPIARAWNDTGHMASAFIAWQELTPAARTKITALLKAHPRYREDLLAGMPDGFPDPGLYAFMKAATWPDAIRLASNPMSRTHHHGNWHYIDFPFVLPEDVDVVHPKPVEESGGQVDNILKALPQAIADAGDPKVSDAEKAIRICWIEHLIGDIHQPLHAISLFSHDLPNGDKGGNLILVARGGGDVIKLHMLWDDLPGPQTSPRGVEFIARRIAADPRLGRRALDVLIKEHTTFRSWAQESFEDAKAFAYLDGQLRYVKSSAATQPGGVPPLPVSYEAVAGALAKQRIALAAHRMADQLNAMFDPPPHP